MLKELLVQDRVTFANHFDSWEDAIRTAAQPLLRDQTITPEYVQAIIDSVQEFGPYIVIAPDIALPHAKSGVGVNQTSMSFMKVEHAVHFSNDAEHDARLFFVLASTDNDSHLDMLAALVEAISEDAFVTQLLQVNTKEELASLLQNQPTV